MKASAQSPQRNTETSVWSRTSAELTVGQRSLPLGAAIAEGGNIVRSYPFSHRFFTLIKKTTSNSICISSSWKISGSAPAAASAGLQLCRDLRDPGFTAGHSQNGHISGQRATESSCFKTGTGMGSFMNETKKNLDILIDQALEEYLHEWCQHPPRLNHIFLPNFHTRKWSSLFPDRMGISVCNHRCGRVMIHPALK